MVVLSAMIFQMNVTKLAYNGPRPFWDVPEINAWSCSVQFGSPSGHSLQSMCAVLAVFLDYKAACRESNHFLAHPLFKALFFAIGVLYTILIGYSRMLLGAHSLDQVLFGWLLGAWLAAALHHIFRRPIMKHANKLLSGDNFNL